MEGQEKEANSDKVAEVPPAGINVGSMPPEDDDPPKEGQDVGAALAPEPVSQELDYGYEEIEKPEPSAEGSSRRRVARRNVVKVDDAVYGVSYHPGRVVRCFRCSTKMSSLCHLRLSH